MTRVLYRLMLPSFVLPIVPAIVIAAPRDPRAFAPLNAGSVALAGGTTDVYGKATNQSGGRVVVSGNSAAVFTDDEVNNGSIQVSAGSAATFLGSFGGANGTSGAGSVFLEGDLRRGNSPAAITFGGNLANGAGARYVMEIGGTALGTQYDSVAVTGTARLDGTLVVQLIDGFTPQTVDRLKAMIYENRIGEFQFEGLELGNGLRLVPEYTATGLDMVTARCGSGRS